MRTWRTPERKQSCHCALQTYSIIFQMPIVIANVSEDETFGILFNATDCPPGLCYNRTTRTKW